MKVFALFYHRERDEECIIGLYESDDNLCEDIKILESIDKLASSLNNKNLHPQQIGNLAHHYSWREVEITPRKQKGE